MNKYTENIRKIEFVITYACSGNCIHCSEGEHSRSGISIDKDTAVKAVKDLKREYDIHTCMTFGGEPLLYFDTVIAIHKEAKKCGIPHRQLITNGYFSSDREKISQVAMSLSKCGVNDLLLSVDAFHQATIPVDIVEYFASELLKFGVPFRTQPAWLVSSDADNKYNNVTRDLLFRFSQLGVSANEGNVVFSCGNALKYLFAYFDNDTKSDPYIEDPYNIKTVSIDPDGSVLGGNCYEKDIISIINEYDPNA